MRALPMLLSGIKVFRVPVQWSGLVCAALSSLPACGTTVDSLGHDLPADAESLRPLTGPGEYPNPLSDVLGLSDEEIAAKIAAVFEHLFYGDPATEAIYFPVGADQAFIRDILHDDIRTEGIGYGMIVAVELDKREEFDRLWTYARAELEYTDGANQGYFRSSCDTNDGATTLCVDPFGTEQFLTALLFAHGRWESNGGIDYEADALRLFHVLRDKEAQNGGVVDGVTNSFDGATQLPFDEPNTAASEYTRPSVVMPAYYELWAQATADAFWSDAAESGRVYWQAAAHPTTGLLPVRAYFDGTPVEAWSTFAPEAYRTHLNMTLDRIWFDSDAWLVEAGDRLLEFFFAQGIDAYGKEYSLDGTVVDPSHDAALVAMNGVTALIATRQERVEFIQAVWDLEPPVGTGRYYSGILHLLALLTLSGQYRVY